MPRTKSPARFLGICVVAIVLCSIAAEAQETATTKKVGNMLYEEVPTSICLKVHKAPPGYRMTWEYREAPDSRVTAGMDSCLYSEVKTPSCKGNYTWNAKKMTCCKADGKCKDEKIDCPEDHPFYTWYLKYSDGIEAPLNKVTEGVCSYVVQVSLKDWCKKEGKGDQSYSGYTPGHPNHDWCYKYVP